jgi:DNA-directed RNA polymerase specialized sigma24 family protein
MAGPPPGSEDVVLARRAALGDDSALRQVLERVTPKIRAMAWHMSYDRETSRDLAQEALLKVVSATTLEPYRGEGPLMRSRCASPDER